MQTTEVERIPGRENDRPIPAIIQIGKGTTVWKDVSGGLGQAHILCSFKESVWVAIYPDWAFMLNGEIYKLYRQ